MICSRVYQRYRADARANFIIAHGRVQRQGIVVHLVVDRLQRVRSDAETPDVRARNFR